MERHGELADLIFPIQGQYGQSWANMDKDPRRLNKPLFTPTFAKRVSLALELNKGEKGDIYHHPSENRIVKKCIALHCRKPLHAADSEHPRSCSVEKWLEAYLIRQAKMNGGMLEMAGKRFQFLYSQLNFRGTVSSKPRPLDLLLYEPKGGHLVVIELKAKRELGRAIEEVRYYSARINEVRDELAAVFGLKKILGVQGYIVWPENDRADTTRHDFGSYGVIEYARLAQPWERFKSLGEAMRIEFVCVREPKRQAIKHEANYSPG